MAARVDEQRLMDTILQDYNTAARPVYNASEKVTVKFGLTLTQISDMVSVSTRLPLFAVTRALFFCLFLVRVQTPKMAGSAGTGQKRSTPFRTSSACSRPC